MVRYVRREMNKRRGRILSSKRADLDYDLFLESDVMRKPLASYGDTIPNPGCLLL